MRIVFLVSFFLSFYTSKSQRPNPPFWGGYKVEFKTNHLKFNFSGTKNPVFEGYKDSYLMIDNDGSGIMTSVHLKVAGYFEIESSQISNYSYAFDSKNNLSVTFTVIDNKKSCSIQILYLAYHENIEAIIVAASDNYLNKSEKTKVFVLTGFEKATDGQTDN